MEKVQNLNYLNIRWFRQAKTTTHKQAKTTTLKQTKTTNKKEEYNEIRPNLYCKTKQTL